LSSNNIALFMLQQHRMLTAPAQLSPQGAGLI
jgi:hypothetical protein